MTSILHNYETSLAFLLQLLPVFMTSIKALYQLFSEISATNQLHAAKSFMRSKADQLVNRSSFMQST